MRARWCGLMAAALLGMSTLEGADGRTDHLAHPTRACRIKRARHRRLQQAFARPGDRVSRRLDLSLPRRSALASSGPPRDRIKGGVLQSAAAREIPLPAREEGPPPMRQTTKRIRRQILVLTPEEKKVVACVLAALTLGLVTQQYRAAHPRQPAPPTAQEQRAAKIAQRSAATKARSARTARAAVPATPPPAEIDDDD
jgi:hypothetical protein